MRPALVVAIALAACADNGTPAPVVYEGHGVRVTVEEAPADISRPES